MPSKVPDGWTLTTLTSVARLESGHTPSRRHPEYWDGGVPWLSLHDSKSLDKPEIEETVQTISELGLANSSARLLPAGTVVFSRTATVGKATILGRPMATSQDFANYVCGDHVHNRYLMQLFRFLQPEWKRLMAGSTHKTIYMPVFENLQVLLPPISEQEKIAEIVASVDEAIDASQAIIDQLQVVKKAMMGELLTKGIPGRHSRFKKTEIGEVPEGWAVVDVLDVVERMRPAGAVQRSAYKTRGKYPVVDQGAEFIAGYTDDASLVVDTTGPTILFGDHTREWKYLDFPFVCGADGTQLLRAKSGINPRFLYFALSALPLKNLGYARHFKLLREAKIALPDCREQGEIANAVQAVVDRENAERAKVAGLRELKAALLSVLLTGEVRVRDGAPIPGPSPVAGEGRAEG